MTFEVTNKGSKVTEVYVYGEQGGEFTKVISEVENIGPGTSRDMSVDLGGWHLRDRLQAGADR